MAETTLAQSSAARIEWFAYLSSHFTRVTTSLRTADFLPLYRSMNRTPNTVWLAYMEAGLTPAEAYSAWLTETAGV